MNRASGCLWLAVALILALLAGGVVFVTLQRASATKTTTGPEVTSYVVVAARPVAAGTVLTDADLTTQALPANALPGGSIVNTSDAIGQVTTTQLEIGEMVLTHHLSKPDIVVGSIGVTVPEGQVAVLLSGDDLVSRAQLAQPGSHVDLYYSLMIDVYTTDQAGDGTRKDTQQYTFGTLDDITIVKLIAGSSVADGSSSGGLFSGGSGVSGLGAQYAYILALEPQDALTLKYLKDAGAVMDLALRNDADLTDHSTQPVDLKYLIDRYALPIR